MNFIRAFTVYFTLREMGGTKTVPLGRRLMVCKTVPFAALFQCPFIKGYQFSCKKGKKVTRQSAAQTTCINLSRYVLIPFKSVWSTCKDPPG